MLVSLVQGVEVAVIDGNFRSENVASVAHAGRKRPLGAFYGLWSGFSPALT